MYIVITTRDYDYYERLNNNITECFADILTENDNKITDGFFEVDNETDSKKDDKSVISNSEGQDYVYDRRNNKSNYNNTETKNNYIPTKFRKDSDTFKSNLFKTDVKKYNTIRKINK